MIPAVRDGWIAIHEAGHGAVAQAFGLDVARITIDPDGAGAGGSCHLAALPSDPRRYLVYVLAGMMAQKHAQPALWEWAMGSGYGPTEGVGDLRVAEEFVVELYPGERGRAVETINAALHATEMVVAELWADIVAMAERLLTERTIPSPADASPVPVDPNALDSP